MKIKFKIFLACIILLLSGCSNSGDREDEIGQAYQSTIELSPESGQELFAEYSYTSVLKNSYVDMNGKIVNDSNYSIYVYAVSENEFLRIKGSMMGNPDTANRIAFYEDEAGSDLILGGWLNGGGWSDKYSIDVTAPKNAKFLFVSSQNGMIPSVRLSQSGMHYYIDSNGMLQPEKNYHIVSYAVRPGEIIELIGSMKGNYNSAARYAFYKDEFGTDLVKIGSLNDGGWEDEFVETITVPTGATTLLVGCQNGSEPKVFWKSNPSYRTKPELENKKIGILGDSMAKGNGTFDGNCWAERIARRNNMEIDNQAINGKYLTQEKWKDSVIGGQYIKLSDDCDIIVICAGTNDITAHIPIGKDDSKDPSTLCGTINTLIPKLREKSPKAKILCITPFLRYERQSDGSYSNVWNKQRAWINKLCDLCEKWDVPCFNNIYRTGIQWNNDSDRRFFSGTCDLTYGDDYHLNNVGLEYVSYLYEDFIAQNIK